MLFRSNIGTWCKDTEKSWSKEKVTIAITCKLLSNFLQQLLAPLSYLAARYLVCP